MRTYSSSLSFSLSTLFSFGLLLAAEPSVAGFRIQQYAPELRWMAQPTPEKAKVEAAIVAPRGLSCYLPSETGFCTIPLLWLTEQNDPASLWRELNGNRIKLATGYDGQVNATVRLGQTPKYEVIQGTVDGGKVLDSAILSAIWDPVVADDMASQKQGELTVQDEGDCQIVTGRDYCEVELSWTTQNVTTASLWQRTAGGLVSVYEGAKEASMKVAAYEIASVYELREGRAIDGQLLAATMTKGHRVQASGELTLPDGASCGLAPGQVSCDIRVSWTTNDVGRLWLREKPMSAIKAQGQSLVTITASGGTVDLRVGGLATGAIMDRANLSTVPMDNAGRIETLNGIVCEIPYSDTSCEQGIRFEIDKGEGTLWSATGESLASGEAAQVAVRSTEYGEAYHLRAGTDVNNPILATYLAKGIKQTYRGSIKLVGADTCTFDVQGGSCSVPAEYEATDKASIWEVSKAQVVSGGSKNGTVNLVVNDETGNDETTANFDLKIHGNYSPKLSDPVLGSVAVRGIQPTHTGQLTAPNGPSCNLLYSSNTCRIDLRVVTTAPSVTLWNDQTGQAVWYGGNGTSNFAYSVAQGAGSYTLREGRKVGNKAFGSLTLTGVRPSYYAQITFPNGANCTTTVSNTSCILSIRLNSNTTTRLSYRDITSNPNAAWIVFSSGIAANGATSFTTPALTENKAYEFRVEQNASPYEPLDVVAATAAVNAPHSFALTSTLPQPGNGMQCRAEWTTVLNWPQCLNSTPITWDTSAPMVTMCRGLAPAGNYLCFTTAAKASSFYNNWSTPDKQYVLDFYEGAVTPSNAADAAAKKYRLLASHVYTPARMMEISEHAIALDKDTYACELFDRDQTSCYVTIRATHTLPYDSVHQSSTSQPFSLAYYIALKGSSTALAGPYINSMVDFGMSVPVGGEDNIYELRLRDGNSSIKATDPVIKSFTASTYYRDVTGYIQAKRVGAYGYESESYYANSGMYPHYFARSYSNGLFSKEAEDCQIQAHQSTCTLYLYAKVSASSRASVFVDGVFVDYFSQNLYFYNNNKFVLNLSEGEHTVAIYDGITASAISNKKIDEFAIRVRRPAYAATMTPRNNDVQLSYYGETQGIAIDFNTNSRGYVYNKANNALLYTTSVPYGADERFRISSAMTATLGSGTHQLEMRSHQDAEDPNNVVLATTTVRLTHKEQTMAIKEFPGYPQYLSSCPVSYVSKSCLIYFSYINGHASNAGIAACAVNASGMRLLGMLNGVTSYSNTSFAVKHDETAINFYNGKLCPSTSANNENYPLLLSHSISPTPTVVDAIIDVKQGGSNHPAITKSETEENTWICSQPYQGSSCLHTISVTPNPSDAPGQYVNAYYGMWSGNRFLAYSYSGNQPYTMAAYTNSSADLTYEVYSCQGPISHQSNCPKATSQYLKSFKVKNHLPDYTGTITAPNGVHCMPNYGQTSCSLSIRFTTNSGYVTLLRDGVAIDAGVYTDKSQTIGFTAKSKGTPTVLTLMDGNATGNRILATLNVYPEVFDQGIFKIESPMTGGVLREPCVFNLLESNEDCVISVDYSSDSSTKYVSHSTPDGTASIDKASLSGDGSLVLRKTHAYRLNQFPYFAGSYMEVIGNNSITVFQDEAKTKLAGSVAIKNIYMQYSDDIFSTPSGLSYIYRENPSGYVRCNSSCYFSLTNWGNILQTDAGLAIDDIILKEPVACNSGQYTQYCGLIDIMTMHKSISPGIQGSITMSTQSNHRVKRIFYKTTAQDLTDPMVTIGGVVRPLLNDGEWHFIDVDLYNMNTIAFSAINDNPTTTKNFEISVFAQYHRIEVQ